MEMENFWKILEDSGRFLYNHSSHDFKIRKGLLLWTRSNKFTAESYRPFLLYCERHHYKTMADLARCRFDQLAASEGLPPRLVSRIKTMFLMYVKQHTEAFLIDRRASRPAATQQKAQTTSNLEGELENFFKQNPDRLIRMPEVTKHSAER